MIGSDGLRHPRLRLLLLHHPVLGVGICSRSATWTGTRDGRESDCENDDALGIGTCEGDGETSDEFV